MEYGEAQVSYHGSHHTAPGTINLYVSVAYWQPPEKPNLASVTTRPPDYTFVGCP